MRARIESLPSPPRWREVEVKVQGGDTKQPMTLYYRDGLECFKFLFGNPLFQHHMDYIPRREYSNEDKTERLYNEIMTGDRAWELQVGFFDHAALGIRLLLFLRENLAWARRWDLLYSEAIKLT